MDILDEKWLPVAGFEDAYAVSDHGRIKSLARTVDMGLYTRDLKERMLSFTLLPGGYRQVQLNRNGKATARLVHRVVLEAFVGPCPDGMEALHRNGVRDDNRPENLRWGTRQQNVRESVEAGLHFGARTHCPNGHEYTPDNTHITKKGTRVCKTCSAARSKRPPLGVRPCDVCGNPVPHTGEKGRPQLRCSAECKRAHANMRDRQKRAALKGRTI